MKSLLQNGELTAGSHISCWTDSTPGDDKWNDDEQSWEDACEGSRFTNTDVVIDGPANNNLHHYKILQTQLYDLKSILNKTEQ